MQLVKKELPKRSRIRMISNSEREENKRKLLYLRDLGHNEIKVDGSWGPYLLKLWDKAIKVPTRYYNNSTVGAIPIGGNPYAVGLGLLAGALSIPEVRETAGNVVRGVGNSVVNGAKAAGAIIGTGAATAYDWARGAWRSMVDRPPVTGGTHGVPAVFNPKIPSIYDDTEVQELQEQEKDLGLPNSGTAQNNTNVGTPKTTVSGGGSGEPKNNKENNQQNQGELNNNQLKSNPLNLNTNGRDPLPKKGAFRRLGEYLFGEPAPKLPTNSRSLAPFRGYSKEGFWGNALRIGRDWQVTMSGIDAIHNTFGTIGEATDSSRVSTGNWNLTRNYSPAGLLIKVTTKDKPASELNINQSNKQTINKDLNQMTPGDTAVAGLTLYPRKTISFDEL